MACGHFWLWCLHPGDSNSTWWQHSKLDRPLVQWCSTFTGSPKKCEIRRWLKIQCHHVLVSTELCRHHLKHPCKLYISCWGWGNIELVPVLWNLSVSGRLHDVLGSIQIWLVVLWARLMAMLSSWNSWWTFDSSLPIWGRHRLVWELLVGASSEWPVSLRAVDKCPWCSKYVLNIEFP